MKLTQWKIARVLLFLPDEDRDKIKAELASEEGLSSESVSTLMNQARFFEPKRFKKGKGCFGKRGTNRKQQKMLERMSFEAMRAAALEREKDGEI